MFNFNNRSAFVLPTTPFRQNNLNRAKSAAPLSGDRTYRQRYSQPQTQTMGIIQQAARTYGNLPPVAKEAVGQAGKQIFDGVKVKVSDAIRVPRNPNAPKYFSGNNGFALSDAPPPVPVVFDTGIRPNTYVSTILDTKENECSPLHMSAVSLKLPTTVGNLLLNYFTNITSFDIQCKAQSNVSFNINITSIFTSANIQTALNALTQALSIYYYYNSIESHANYRDHKNGGMTYLRSGMTANMIEDLRNLEMRLLDTPIPPGLLETIRFMYSNYTSGYTQGSPILKFCPHFMDSTGVAAGQITSAITGLAAGNNNEVFSLISRAVPHWKITTLPSIPYETLYDQNFLTIWANAPFVVTNGTVATNYPQVTTDSTEIQYNSFTNTLDGMVYALNSVFNTTGSVYNPGLLVPVGDVTNGSRKSYYDVGGTKQLRDISTISFLNRARPETYYVSNTATYAVSACHLAGSDRCKGVSVNSITETAYKAVNYLVSLDTIAKPGMKSGFTGSSGSVKKGRKR